MVFAMKVIIKGYGVFVGVKNKMIYIKNEDGEKLISAGNIRQIVVASSGVSLSSSLLRLASENNIDIIILNPNGSIAGRFYPSIKKANVQVRKEQYEAQFDERGLHLARCFVRGKILNQYYLLKSLIKNRKRRDLLSECYGIKKRAENVDKCTSQSDLIQEEAKAAEIYWNTISQFYNINGRRKRYDNPDAFNMALNYGYAILMSYVMLAIDATNLDPFAGFLHVENPRRPALVVDLIEEFRQPVVDRAVFKVSPEEKNGLLTKKTRGEIISEINNRLATKVTFNGRKLPIEYHIHLQARRLERFLLGKEKYKPFVLR
ncbi:CRISPR-associated endonuclease Cas1 [Archaeoglobales archaeon]|nr:MAG: CRISPR-associated endonuclease Cas1 [Archaeoglobales archaeon]